MLPKLSTTEYLIMDQLRAGTEKYGLQLVKDSGGALKRGTVYVLLSRLTEKGFVTSRQEKNRTDPGIPRRIYRISAEGNRVLASVDAARIAGIGGSSFGWS